MLTLLFLQQEAPRLTPRNQVHSQQALARLCINIYLAENITYKNITKKKKRQKIHAQAKKTPLPKKQLKKNSKTNVNSRTNQIIFSFPLK